MRHCAATVVLAAGQSIKVISEILGHATSAFTADVYIEVVEELADSVAAAVAAYIPRRDKPGAVTP
jgi:site-specific recombinase XerD